VIAMFYSLIPEVAGALGEKSEMDNSVQPPVISRLHHELKIWLGDDLLDSFPCFIVTEKLRSLIASNSPSGCEFDEVEISTSDEFNQLYPDRRLPSFYWLKVTGQPGIDDFGISKDYTLIVSSRILEVMSQACLDNCDIEEYEN
jgi:hypothetical protein